MAKGVLTNDDLVHLILEHAQLSPSTFVGASRVCKTWRNACMRDASLLIKAASSCKYMTKRIVMGMFALSSAEANTLPRKVLPIYGGIMYQYDPQVATDAVDKAGGVDGIRRRLKKRSLEQASIEVAFGEHWKRLQWYPHQRLITC